MNMQGLQAFLHSCVRASISGVMLSKPGVGKTSAVKQLAAATGRQLLILEGAYLKDEVSLQGIPCNVDGRTRWCPPESLEIDDNAIIFIDDFVLSTAQEMLYALLLDKRIDTRTLPDTVSIFAAGNREEDGGTRYEFSPVIANRCAVTMEYEGPTLAEWRRWALGAGISPLVLTAVEYHPELLHRWNARELRNPTPRSWELASRLLAAGGQSALDALTQTVGAKTAAQCEIIIEHAKAMVSPDSILNGTAEVPTDKMLAYLSAANFNHVVSPTMTVKQAVNAINYAEAVLATHSGSFVDVLIHAMRKVRGMSNVPEYVEFTRKWGKYV